MSQLGELGQEVVETEFPYLTGTDQTVAENNASGWFEANLGKLNSLIYSSYSGQDPNLNLEERAIYKQMYLDKYYTALAGSVIRGADSSTMEWLTLREGDSSIERLNKNEVAKTYRGLASDARSQVSELVSKYNSYQGSPRQVSVFTTWSGEY